MIQRMLSRSLLLLARATSAAKHALIRTDPTHCICPECAVDFVPELTNSRCPICGWLAVEKPPVLRADPAERRLMTGLGFAWFAGAVIFALVAHFLYA